MPPSGNGQMGGELRIASTGSVQSFDPLWTTASGTANVAWTILEGLVGQTDDWGLGMLLLESWDTSDDGLTWTFKIREGVAFHDGTPLTTDQVIATLDRQKEGAPVLALVWSEFGPENFDEFVQKEDDYTFTINLESQTGLVLDALGPQNFTPLIVTEEWAAVSQQESAPGDPIGTGPYEFEEWLPGDRWTAVRYDNYSPSSEPTDGWAGAHTAYFDRIVYIEVSDQTTRVAALETDEVDMIQEFPADLTSRLRDHADVQLVANPPSRLLGHFNHVETPFDQREARRALVMAYDNESALLLATGDEDSYNLCPSLMQCGTVWETDAGSEGLYNAQRVDEAAEIIAGLGLAGTRVRLMDPQDRQPAHGAAQISREVLIDIGFDVEYQTMDWATMVTRRADTNLWEFFHTWSGSAVRAGPVGHLRFGELQYDAWFNKYQDVEGSQRELLEALARETDEAEIDRLMEEFQEYFYEDAIFLQVGEFFSHWAARSRMQGIVEGSPAAQHPFDKWFEN